MSTLRTNNLQNPDSGDVNLQLTQDGGAVFVGLVTTNSLNVNGNVTIGGTITYEDVTNIDSIGIITARSGIIGDLTGNVTGDIVGNLAGTTTIAGISSEISDTAVDIFVYDTSKDSDGGAWRKRTQHTSWYNETLNTATRGSRREFPAVAVLVLEGTKLTIYDGDDPDLPMWMVFDRASSAGWTPNTTNILGVSYSTFTSISMLNGIFAMGADYASDNSNGVLIKVSFAEDTGYFHGIQSVSASYPAGGFGRYRGSIAERDSGKGHVNINDTDKIVNVHVNDVAMTVLPNAPVDDATGLPVPTIVVATDGGASVIKDDGNVYDDTDATALGSVDFNDDYRIISTRKATGSAAVRFFISKRIDTVSSDTAWLYEYYTGNFASGYPRLRSEDTGAGITLGLKGDTSVRGSNIGFTLWDVNSNQIGPNEYSTNSLLCGISTDFNTGWMHGDIKGAFLSDTDATNVTGTELVTNGTFDSDISGWTDNSGSGSSISWSSGTIYLDGAVAYAKADQQITTVAGKTYVMSAEVSGQGGAETSQIWAGTAVNTSDLGFTVSSAAYNGVMTLTFTATTTTTWIRLYTGWNTYFDNVSVRLAEEDRSVNNKGLQVFGTVNKTAVAGSGDTAAELVAYSGFSDGDYLKQPHNTSLEFGTGNFSCTVWFKSSTTDTSNYKGLVYLNRNGSIGEGFQILLSPSNGLYFYVYGPSNDFSGVYHNGYNDGNWHQISVSSTGTQQKVYIDGVLKETGNITTGSITDTNSELFVGKWYGNTSDAFYWRGSIALLRISGSIPSPEQIKKIYEDEKVLFQENAACTLHGSSDAVTALAYDEVNDLLHVGTSSGRSDFNGLRRINNTTTAVTTAISAYDGLIAAQ